MLQKHRERTVFTDWVIFSLRMCVTNICLQRGNFLDYQGSSNWSACFFAGFFLSVPESNLLKKITQLRKILPPRVGILEYEFLYLRLCEYILCEHEWFWHFLRWADEEGKELCRHSLEYPLLPKTLPTSNESVYPTKNLLVSLYVLMPLILETWSR